MWKISAVLLMVSGIASGQVSAVKASNAIEFVPEAKHTHPCMFNSVPDKEGMCTENLAFFAQLEDAEVIVSQKNGQVRILIRYKKFDVEK